MGSRTTIGVDIDNTIIDYTGLFEKRVLERFQISFSEGITKNTIKSTVVGKFGELAWTQLQGIVYAEALSEQVFFPGAVTVIERWLALGIELRLLSHKTRFPLVGPKVDLRQATYRLLSDTFRRSVDSKQLTIEFFETQSQKIEAINNYAPNLFIDDLVAVIDKVLPPIRAIHFKCDCNFLTTGTHEIADDWSSLGKLVEQEYS